MMPNIEASDEEGDTLKLSTERVNSGPCMNIAFNVEKVLIFGYLYFTAMFVACTIVTATLVDFPNGSFEKTVIYKRIGFNHFLTVFTFHPARQIGAVLSPGFIVLMSLSITLSYFRIRNEYHNGYLPPLLYRYTQAITPISLFAILEFGMIFINDLAVEDNFNTLYVPFTFFQVVMGLLAIQQVLYFIIADSIPLKISRNLAKFYLLVLIIVALVYQVWNISIIANKQMYSKMTPTLLLPSKILVQLHSVLVFIVPPVLALQERKKNDGTLKIEVL